MCVCSSVRMHVCIELFSQLLQGPSSRDTDPHDTPAYPTDTCWMPVEYPHPACTPAGIKMALCQTASPYKHMGCGGKGQGQGKGTNELILTSSSFNFKDCLCSSNLSFFQQSSHLKSRWKFQIHNMTHNKQPERQKIHFSYVWISLWFCSGMGRSA